MNDQKIFLLQLFASFVLGGGFVAFLSFLSEKASERTAGIILSLPSTLMVSLFFIAWTISPQKIAEIFPVIPPALGMTTIFVIFYVSIAQTKLSKIQSIFLASIGGSLFWLIGSVPLAIYKFSNVGISLLLYLILAGIGYYFLTIKPTLKISIPPLSYTSGQKIFRACFAGLFITLAVFLAKALGSFWGGIMSVFPAAFLSTLIIVHWYYPPQFLFKITKNIPLGSVTFIVFAAVAGWSFPIVGILWGTIISYTGSLLTFVVVRKIAHIS